MIAIRTDANKELATGHVMRCLTLAEELRSRDVKVVFITSETESREIIKRHRFEVLFIKGSWKNPHLELEQLKEIILTDPIEKLVVDSCYADTRYLQELNRLVPVMYFDDFFKEKYDVRYLVNYNAFYKIYDYGSRYRGTKTQCLLGEKYVPIRKEFRENTVGHKEGIRNILMICGGGDRLDALGKQLDYFIRQPDFSEYIYWVIVGRLNDNKEEILRRSKEHGNIKVLYDVTNMAQVMLGCDIAVSAASTVLYELCAVGLPCIFYEVSDDQKMDRLFFEEHGIMMYAGSFLKDSQACMAQIWKQLRDISPDMEKWKHYSSAMKQVVDGKGVKRLADSLLN